MQRPSTSARSTLRIRAGLSRGRRGLFCFACPRVARRPVHKPAVRQATASRFLDRRDIRSATATVRFPYAPVVSTDHESSDGPRDATPASAAPRPAPLPLTVEDEPCPNCGAALPGPAAVLCTQCGYDLAAARARATVVGRPIEKQAAESGAGDAGASEHQGFLGMIFGRPAAGAANDDSLVRSPGVRLPLAIAGGCAAAMVIGHLAGAAGLFQRVDGLFNNGSGTFTAASPPWSERFSELGRWSIHVVVVWIAASVGLLVVAQIRRSSIGDLATAAARMAAIVLAASLFGLVAFPSRLLEGIVEPLCQSAVFVAGLMAWLRLRLSEGIQVLALMVLGALGITGLSWIVAWAI